MIRDNIMFAGRSIVKMYGEGASDLFPGKAGMALTIDLLCSQEHKEGKK